MAAGGYLLENAGRVPLWVWAAGFGFLCWLFWPSTPKASDDAVDRDAPEIAAREDSGGVARWDWVSNHAVDWTNVPLRSNGLAATGEYGHVEYTCTTTAGKTYVVTLFRSGNRAWAVCTCQAGEKRHVCRHRTALYARLPDLAEFLDGTELGEAWAAFDAAATADPECASEEYQRTRWALRDAMRPPRGMGRLSVPQGPSPTA